MKRFAVGYMNRGQNTIIYKDCIKKICTTMNEDN
jgi:hypothetical protein